MADAPTGASSAPAAAIPQWRDPTQKGAVRKFTEHVCELCGVVTSSADNLAQHVKSKKHKRKERPPPPPPRATRHAGRG